MLANSQGDEQQNRHDRNAEEKPRHPRSRCRRQLLPERREEKDATEEGRPNGEHVLVSWREEVRRGKADGDCRDTHPTGFVGELIRVGSRKGSISEKQMRTNDDGE